LEVEKLRTMSDERVGGVVKKGEVGVYQPDDSGGISLGPSSLWSGMAIGHWSTTADNACTVATAIFPV
jgi:hypothetical protein